jgi:hypothetical protein
MKTIINIIMTNIKNEKRLIKFAKLLAYKGYLEAMMMHQYRKMCKENNLVLDLVLNS